MEWFKFKWSHWMTGKIFRESASVQADFMTLICLYAKDNGLMTIEEAKTQCLDDKSYSRLVSRKIIKEVGEHIEITFLKEQIEEHKLTLEKRSKAGKASAESRAKKKGDNSTPVEHVLNKCSTGVQQKERKREGKPSKGLPDTLTSENPQTGHTSAGEPLSRRLLRSLPNDQQKAVKVWIHKNAEKLTDEFVNFAIERKSMEVYQGKPEYWLENSWQIMQYPKVEDNIETQEVSESTETGVGDIIV